MRRREPAPPPPPGPVSDAEVALLGQDPIHFEDWLAVEDEAPEPRWRGDATTSRLEHLAVTRVLDAMFRASAAGRLTTEDVRRIREVDAGCGCGWGPDGIAFLRAWHERRWPMPDGAVAP